MSSPYSNNNQDIAFELDGFRTDAVAFDRKSENNEKIPITSNFSQSEAIEFTQLVSLTDGEGKIIFYPERNGKGINLEIGDVLFLREKAMEGELTHKRDSENGLIIQVISLGTANYPQSDVKAIFRLMLQVRASTIERSFNEPKEVIDDFLLAEFKVRASIINGEWSPPAGKVVTRNIDIFMLNPEILTKNILVSVKELDLNLGDYKKAPISFWGGGFEKINLITGMKGAGKSHIAKGIISESLKTGMSAVVFDINNEYSELENENTNIYTPGENFKFRLDRMKPKTFLSMVNRLAPFAEKTQLIAQARIPKAIRQRKNDNKCPDIHYLKTQSRNIIKGDAPYLLNMRSSYESSLDIIDTYNMIITSNEALMEDNLLRGKSSESLRIKSLTSILHKIMDKNKSEIIVIKIGGLQSYLQYTIVDMILDTLKDLSIRQFNKYKDSISENAPEEEIYTPIFPTIYFEEAHMYMEPKVINELLPLIRHYGMNVFFITNTPKELPDSVFRLMDNLIMTRMVNKKDIDQVKNCGLTDAETISGFASNLKQYNALFLSGLNGATKNFPLIFKVRDFGLPKSGETRSMWQVMRNKKANKCEP